LPGNKLLTCRRTHEGLMRTPESTQNLYMCYNKLGALILKLRIMDCGHY